MLTVRHRSAHFAGWTAEGRPSAAQYDKVGMKTPNLDALAKKSLTEASEQPYAVIQNLHKANDALFEKLMDLEMSASERYSESIHSFESSYEELA